MNQKERRERRRKIATEFVVGVNTRTACLHCGGQPIEWHREEHELHSNWRVSSLRTQGASVARIQAEMDVCEPLCRRCHMREDGRLEKLQAAQPYKKGQTYTAPAPCSNCGKMSKPTRRGRCNYCYIKHMGIR